MSALLLHREHHRRPGAGWQFFVSEIFGTGTKTIRQPIFLILSPYRERWYGETFQFMFMFDNVQGKRDNILCAQSPFWRACFRLTFSTERENAHLVRHKVWDSFTFVPANGWAPFYPLPSPLPGSRRGVTATPTSPAAPPASARPEALNRVRRGDGMLNLCPWDAPESAVELMEAVILLHTRF